MLSLGIVREGTIVGDKDGLGTTSRFTALFTLPSSLFCISKLWYNLRPIDSGVADRDKL